MVHCSSSRCSPRMILLLFIKMQSPSVSTALHQDAVLVLFHCSSSRCSPHLFPLLFLKMQSSSVSTSLHQDAVHACLHCSSSRCSSRMIPLLFRNSHGSTILHKGAVLVCFHCSSSWCSPHLIPLLFIKVQFSHVPVTLHRDTTLIRFCLCSSRFICWTIFYYPSPSQDLNQAINLKRSRYAPCLHFPSLPLYGKPRMIQFH